jgi:hypothetical protein
MHPRVHWCDLLIGAAALWLMASPVMLGYDLEHSPNWQAPALNAYAVGTGLLIFCVLSAWRLEDLGNEILNIVFGCWLVLSPFALAFSDWRLVTLNTIAVGLVVIMFAILDLSTASRNK